MNTHELIEEAVLDEASSGLNFYIDGRGGRLIYDGSDLKKGLLKAFSDPRKLSNKETVSVSVKRGDTLLGGIDWIVWIEGSLESSAVWFPGVASLRDLGYTKAGRNSYRNWLDAFWEAYRADLELMTIAAGKGPGLSRFIRPGIVKIKAGGPGFAGSGSTLWADEDESTEREVRHILTAAAGRPKGKKVYHADV